MSTVSKEITPAFDDSGIRARKEGRLRECYLRYESIILKVLGICTFLGLWELSVIIGWAKPIMVSSPSRVAVAGVDYIASDSFLVDAATSGIEFFFGFGLALVVGIALGFAMGWFRRVEYFLDPIVNFLYASPRIALVPLLVLWFGIGIESKIAIIFLMAVFPVAMNTSLAVRSVDKDLIDLARSFNASGWQLLRSVVVPSSIPLIVTGMRIGLGVALIGVVVGEFMAATAGIGHRIEQAASSFETDKVFVGLIIIGTCGVIFTETLRQIEGRLAKWKTT
ncbi:MAG: ABC-type nitrate/sulfonate/bicarbonate transport system, permease component [Noviherbaspirillum sp.]|nr:ABC-type nitrate/sulfonate/bicarbonate transport system, permease component [Noviherbaspirillum sp.]